MNSVLKNEEAIMRYVRQLKPGIDSNKGRNTARILSHLKNPNFWTSLEQARNILEPLHQTQYLFEAEDYSLSRVLHNWNKIRADLYSKAKKIAITLSNAQRTPNTLYKQRPTGTHWVSSTWKRHLQDNSSVSSSRSKAIAKNFNLYAHAVVKNATRTVHRDTVNARLERQSLEKDRWQKHYHEVVIMAEEQFRQLRKFQVSSERL